MSEVLQSLLNDPIDRGHRASREHHLLHTALHPAVLKLGEAVEQDEGLLCGTILGLVTMQVEAIEEEGGALGVQMRTGKFGTEEECERLRKGRQDVGDKGDSRPS